MQLELDIFDKDELIRGCQLIGYKNKNGKLNKKNKEKLEEMILKKVNPEDKDLREQYIATLDLFKVKYSKNADDLTLKKKLYEFNCKKLEEAISKMSVKKKKKLSDKIEASIEPTVLEGLKKSGRKGAIAGGGLLALQGGAIFITGSNLGICMLMTSGLSGISSILGVTFPFAAYMSAGALGGWILGVAGFLANPFVAVPLIGGSLYLIYRKSCNRQYVNLAGINYLIESKKALDI